MASTRILAFAGSLRKESYNRKLLAIACAGAEAAGAEVTVVDLNDYAMPFMNEDLESESGAPEKARELKALMKAHDGYLIASPEYNGSFSGVLKNTIDWCSRLEEGESVLECFRGKNVALLASSTGMGAGARGLTQLRTVLAGIGCLILPTQVTVGKAAEAFDAEGKLVKPKQQENAENLGKSLVELCVKLKAS